MKRRKNIPPTVNFSKEASKEIESTTRKYIVLSIFAIIYVLYVAIALPIQYDFFTSFKALATEANTVDHGWMLCMLFILPHLLVIGNGVSCASSTRDFTLVALNNTFGNDKDCSRTSNAAIALRGQILVTLFAVYFTQMDQEYFSNEYWCALWMASTYFSIAFCALTVVLTISDWGCVPKGLLSRYLTQIALCVSLIILIGAFRIAELDDIVITLIYENKPLFGNEDFIPNLLAYLSFQDDLMPFYLIMYMLFEIPVIMLHEITLDLKDTCICGKAQSLKTTKQCWYDNFSQFANQDEVYELLANRTLYKNSKKHLILPILIVLFGSVPLILRGNLLDSNPEIKALFELFNYINTTTSIIIVVIGIIMFIVEITAMSKVAKMKKEGQSIIKQMSTKI